jgi:hypothetical protein
MNAVLGGLSVQGAVCVAVQGAPVACLRTTGLGLVQVYADPSLNGDEKQCSTRVQRYCSAY